jgi:hypothetical protein
MSEFGMSFPSGAVQSLTIATYFGRLTSKSRQKSPCRIGDPTERKGDWRNTATSLLSDCSLHDIWTEEKQDRESIAGI